jgi:hypothetical protein
MVNVVIPFVENIVRSLLESATNGQEAGSVVM